jgi:hypothetical protein
MVRWKKEDIDGFHNEIRKSNNKHSNYVFITFFYNIMDFMYF